MEQWQCPVEDMERRAGWVDVMFDSVYQDRRVFITGHTGFKGSWLALWLSEMGARIVGYSLPPPTSPNHFDLLNHPLTHLEGDIRDFKNLSSTINAHQPEIVFHLAAQPLVRRSYQSPRETFETNVMGTVNLLEACRITPSVKAVINITSDKCYENQEWVWGYRETDPMGGFDPYSASKGAAELITSAYRSAFFHPDHYPASHGLLVASARAGNVLGGGDWAEDRLIPDIMRSVSRGKKVVIRNPEAIRPWQHVLEPLSGYLYLGERLLKGKRECAEAWNFGPGEEMVITVEELAKHVPRFWDAIDYEVHKPEMTFHEANWLKLDCSKAHRKLKWRSIWGTEETLAKTVKWYKAYYQDGTIKTHDDLDQYIKDAERKGLVWAR